MRDLYKLTLIMTFSVLLSFSLCDKYQLIVNMGKEVDNYVDSTRARYNYDTYLFAVKFFDSKSDLTGYTVNSFVAAADRNSYIKRSDNEVYAIEGDLLELFPTIKGNHPIKHILYQHLHVKKVSDTYEFYFKITYFHCLESALSFYNNKDNYNQEYGVYASSIWTPYNVHMPSELRSISSITYPYYNLAYPATYVKEIENIRTNVYFRDLIIPSPISAAEIANPGAYDDTGAYKHCKNVDDWENPDPDTDYDDDDVLISLDALFHNDDICTNLGLADSQVNFYKCNNEPSDSSASCSDYVKHVNVVEICFLGPYNKIGQTFTPLLADGTTNGSVQTFKTSNLFIRARERVNDSGTRRR